MPDPHTQTPEPAERFSAAPTQASQRTAAEVLDARVSLRDLDTRVSLRDYFEALLRESEARGLARQREVEKAVLLAETTTRESFEKHNGLLQMMQRQSDEYARKAETKNEMTSMSKRLDEVSTRVYWLLGVSAAAGAAAAQFIK